MNESIMKLSNLLTLLKSLPFCLAFVSGTVAASAADWSGRWIGPETVAESERRSSWWCFRETLSVDEAPGSFPVKIACDSKYWLWINGDLVVLEGGLKRGPTRTGSYYDVVDIADWLYTGDNAIAILVWHFGKHGFSHNDSGKIGLLVDGGTKELVLRSDSDWLVRRHPAYHNADDPGPNYRLPEGNIRYDAREALPGWQTDVELDGWAPATELGEASDPPWGELVERPIPQWKDYGRRDYVSVREIRESDLDGRSRDIWSQREGDMSEQPDRILVGELPYNAHVHPYLSITAPAGLTIHVQTDLLTNGRDMFLRAEYVTREGRQDFEFPGWLNGHEVRYFLPEGVTVHELGYRETGYDAEISGSFESDNPRVNALWEQSLRTLLINMRDTYMDCPERERAQWWGDVVIQLAQAFYALDPVQGPLLARKGILELAAWQREDDVLYSPVPAGIPEGDERVNLGDGTWDRELPRQMLLSIGYYGFWHYYRYTGDVETIREVYPAVRRYLSIWEIDPDGLVRHRPGDWNWTDWGTNKDVPIIENAIFHLALRGAAEMADLLGKPTDAAEYREVMAGIEAAFNATFWQGEYYRSPDYEDETDDRANAMAVVAGLAEPEYYPAIARFLQTTRHASPYMEKFVLESFFLMGKPEAGIERMLLRYGPMLDDDYTTLWEHFGPEGGDQPGFGTYNHAWSGGPLTLMHRYMAGIEPSEPGFERFSVRPQLGPLERVSTTVPTPHGPIEFTARRVGSDRLAMELKVPEGTVADVRWGDINESFDPGRYTFEADGGNR